MNHNLVGTVYHWTAATFLEVFMVTRGTGAELQAEMQAFVMSNVDEIWGRIRGNRDKSVPMTAEDLRIAVESTLRRAMELMAPTDRGTASPGKEGR